FYINLPSQYAKQGLDILADALQNTRMQPSEVEQERKVVLDEYRISLESPGAIVQGLIYSMVFKNHPYRLPIIGTEKSLKGMGIQDFVDFKRKWYVPDRTVLVLVGDLNPQQIMPAVREYFGTFSGPAGPAESVSQEASKAEVREHVERRDLQNAFVVYGFRAPSVRDRPDIYSVDLLTFLLGQGDGSLLAKLLLEEKKIALAASCDFLTQRDPGVITCTATTQPGNVEKVRTAMTATIADVRAGKFTDKDFKRAKALLMNTYRFGNETNAGKADGLGFYAAIDQVEFAQSYLDEVDKLTVKDVVEAANKYLDQTNFSVLVVRPPDRKASADE
ncbi:MAG: insulinase family protein, partial [Armatimonadetes bacterium]|nr:insulinase family protein [Armatimonadota bacterium]